MYSFVPLGTVPLGELRLLLCTAIGFRLQLTENIISFFYQLALDSLLALLSCFSGCQLGLQETTTGHSLPMVVWESSEVCEVDEMIEIAIHSEQKPT